jgi:hypothetical protein
MNKTEEAIQEEIFDKLKTYRKRLIDIIEYNNQFYKAKLKEIEKIIKKIRLKIEKDMDLKKSFLWAIKDKLKEIEKIKKHSIKKEEIEKILENLKELKQLSKIDVQNFDERYYEENGQYDFYKDLKSIIINSKKEIFIIDSYLHEDILNIYLDKILPNIKINILTNSKTPKGNFPKIARMFSKKHQEIFEVRENEKCHDRAIFLDNDGWIIGNSIKDNAKNKPAYLIKLRRPKKLKEIYRKIWHTSTKIK